MWVIPFTQTSSPSLRLPWLKVLCSTLVVGGVGDLSGQDPLRAAVGWTDRPRQAFTAEARPAFETVSGTMTTPATSRHWPAGATLRRPGFGAAELRGASRDGLITQAGARSWCDSVVAGPPDSPRIVGELARAIAGWENALATGDAAAVGRAATDDAEFWVHGAPAMRGRDALVTNFAGLFAQYEVTQEVTCEQLWLSDSLALVYGPERNRLMHRQSGAVTAYEQRAFTLLRLGGDGRWRLDRGMTNLVTPLPSGGAIRPELADLIAAERAFSRASVRDGMRDAFLAFLTDDAVTFTPQPRVGIEALRAEPATGPTLEWWPEFADVAATGDLGYTTGPYRVTLPDGDMRFGHYHSVWQRQDDGEWRVVLDIGGPHSEMPRPEVVAWPLSVVAAGLDTETDHGATLREAETDYGRMYARNAEAAVTRFLSEQARVYRFGQLPLLGQAAAQADRMASGELLAWDTRGAGSSMGGDLGFTWGVGTVARQETQHVARAMSYARVWRRAPNGRWRIVLEVVLPHPPQGS